MPVQFEPVAVVNDMSKLPIRAQFMGKLFGQESG
jgi:hypothetical protein